MSSTVTKLNLKNALFKGCGYFTFLNMPTLVDSYENTLFVS